MAKEGPMVVDGGWFKKKEPKVESTDVTDLTTLKLANHELRIKVLELESALRKGAEMYERLRAEVDERKQSPPVATRPTSLSKNDTPKSIREGNERSAVVVEEQVAPIVKNAPIASGQPFSQVKPPKRDKK